jgi:acetyltransferase
MNFDPLFRPKTMAVIGVSSTNDRHPANVIYNKINLRYPIRVYPVNPKGGRLQQERLYPDVASLPKPVDHAVIAARAVYVPDILRQCIQSKVGGATVVSGGFAEIGRKDLQDEIMQLALENDFPLVGPNCLGIYSPTLFDTFFLPGERLVRPQPGNVAFVSQSGGVLVDQMVKFAGQSVGVSLAVSIGNKAVIRELDLLEYLSKDPETDVIAFYIEGFKQNEGREFVQAAGRCPKPVIVLKAGKSFQGTQAVSSHTASMAGDYRVFSQVLAQFGIAEAQNEFELISFCEALSCYQQSIEGRVGIVTVSGGHGVLCVDACIGHGLLVPPLTEEIKKLIRQGLSPSLKSIASLSNPIDLTGSATDGDFIAAASAMGNAPDVEAILILLLPYSPGISTDIGARLSNVYRNINKPIVAYVPHVEKYRIIIEGFELNRVPVSSSIEGAVLMLKAMQRCRPC